MIGGGGDGGVMDDLLDFLGNDGGSLGAAGELPRTAGLTLAAAAAARGGDAERQQEEDEHNHCSDDYSDHHP